MNFKLVKESRLKLEDAFELNVFFVLAAAFVTAVSSSELRPIPLFAILAFLGGAVFFDRRLRALPVWWWNSLILVALFSSAVTAFFPVRSFESYYHALIGFLIYTSAIQYFRRRSARDYLLIILLSLLLVAASTVLTISISFLFLLLVFVALLMSSLMLHTMVAGKRRIEDHEKRTDPGGPRFRVPRRFFFLPLSSSVIVFAAGLALFFIIPRMGRGLFTWTASIHSRVSGFSDTVEFGSVGDIMENRSLVMRVKLEEKAGDGPFYFRGNALDFYTGRGWRDSRGAKAVHFIRYGRPVSFAEITSLDRVIRQEVILEPADTDLLFGLPRIVSAEIPFRFRSVLEYENNYLGLTQEGPIPDRMAYTAWSMTSPRTESECREALTRGALPAEPHLLQLPDQPAPFSELAARVTAGAGDDCRRVFAIRDHFLSGYVYDLDTPSEQAADPVVDFLANSRRGYCEYFATAMVLMLRSQGIPARIAAGYLAEDYNSIDGYYRVRQDTAHAWVEVPLPDGQWLLVDPTPPSGRQGSSNSVIGWIGSLIDSMLLQWDRYVIDLTFQDQYRAAETAADKASMAMRGLASLPGRIGSWMSLAARSPLWAGAVVVLAIYMVWRAWSTRQTGRGGRPEAALKEFRKLLGALAREGFARRDSETLSELCGRVVDAGKPYGGAVRSATRAYQAARFGDGDEVRAVSAVHGALLSIRQSRKTVFGGR